MNSIYIIIGVIVLILIISIIALISSNKNKESESEASILDIEEVGVPNSSETKDFSYGYEKEETIVMNPISEEEKKEEIK